MASSSFDALPLHGDVARALRAMQFHQPSPIQRAALPMALFGNDVIGQAKSGTGKTAVFGITAVEQAIAANQQSASEMRIGPCVLILAPTREIALQIDGVLRQLAQFRPECVIQTLIGGLPIAQDQVGCGIAILCVAKPKRS